MYTWEKLFQQTALDKGKAAFLAKRVVDLKEDNGTYSAAVLGKERFDVKITLENGKPKRGKCGCPVAKGRSLCEHMAALLYVIEDEKVRQEKKRIHEEEEAERRRLARERRKKEKSQREAQKRLAEEERQKKEAKERAEKEKQEEETWRREERRRREEEARKRADARQKEEARRLLEEQRKEAEEARRRIEERDKDYTLLEDSWEEESGQEDVERDEASIISLENYRYFDIAKVRASVDFPADALKNGGKIYQNGGVTLKNLQTGFDRYTGQMCCEVTAAAKDKGGDFPLSMMVGRTEVLRSRCGCPKCARMFYSYALGSQKSTCKYSAAFIDAFEDCIQRSSIKIDATDWDGELVMNAFGGGQQGSDRREGENKTDGQLRIEPKLNEKMGRLQASFRIGSEKMFVVKKLDELCENVKNGADAVYGSSTTYNHRLSNFTEEGQRWMRFINKVVREEELFRDRLGENGYYYDRFGSVSGKAVDLYGWRLDDFFEAAAQTGSVEYELFSGRGKKKKEILKTQIKNPDITVDITEEKFKDTDEFQGVRVKMALPAMYPGTEADYYIKNGFLNRADAEFAERIKPLTESGEGGQISFTVGRNRLNTFYCDVLPELAEVARIRDRCKEKAQDYLTPEAKFVFYLDAEDGDVYCRMFARYGQREFSVVEAVAKEEIPELYRSTDRELDVFYTVMRWLPFLDEERDALCCDKDENLIWEVMSEGVDALVQMGEVKCTDSFRKRRVIRRVKTRVGVSVSEGLLELEISADDLERKELEELLRSYRMKKRYHRLTDGSYVSLEETSLATLNEIMKTLSLNPRELAEGKVNLPLYRALYLDRMLAENDEIYSRRDAHFREMVKGFKTITDSEFEEPSGLSDVMRNYQKEGFKWLRTLEEWNLGGILADDMGLGKTLQTIALFLSAKQEGREGTALVIAPAALVYNWEEELNRFAPELSVQVIAGSQEERKEKIGQYADYDVLVTSYDTLRRDIHLYKEKEFRYEVIDEAQYIKNHTTAAAKAVKVISSRQRFALTGTPIENRLSELWSIFDYLMPGFLYGYETFRREFETPIVKSYDENAMKRLQKMTAPFILRRLKENVLKDLPEKLEKLHYVRFEGEQKRLYDAQVLHMKEMLSAQADDEFNKNRFQVLAELTRLRQICCSPGLCFENYKGEAAKADACVEVIRSAMDGGHRMLVFSQFTSMLEILEEKMDEEGISYFVITGATTKEERLRLVKEFNSGTVPVFFISLKAGGVGLNLTGADVVIHYDPWWNQAVQNQATDRAHRIGQTKKVTVYKLIAKHTIEEKIQRLQETKQDLAERIISGETGQLAGMSREDILALLDGE